MKLSPYVISAPATSQLLAIDPECQDDPFYRYQTHQLVVAFQGKRALLTNLDTVAHNLQTSADYLATYLATSLNTVVKRDKATAPKQGGSSRQMATSWTLYPATFTLDKINLCFRAFLTSFVMCPSCARPELIDVVADPLSKPASPRGQEALLDAPASSSPPSSSASASAGPAKAKKARAGAAKKVAAKSVTVRCQSCGWNEPLAKSLRRVKKNVKFVDYVLAHPPQQSSPTLMTSLPTSPHF